MNLNAYRNTDGFIELDKLNPKKLKDSEVLDFFGLILLGFSDSEEILFKNLKVQNFYKLYSSLVASEIAKQLGLPHTEYDIGIYNDCKGLISWNFLEKDEVLILGSEIIYSINLEYETGYNNNLKDILEALKLYIRDEGMAQKIIEDLTINYYMFDIAISEEDRHANNWGIIFNPRESTYRCANVFDTDSMAKTYSRAQELRNMLKEVTLLDKTIDINKMKIYSGDSKQRLFYDSRELDLSSDFALFCRDKIELAKKGFGIISKIDIKDAFEKVEAKIGIKLPEDYKEWLKIMVGYRINLMKEIINNVETLNYVAEEGSAPKI